MQAVTLMFTLRGLDWPRVVAGYDPASTAPAVRSIGARWGYADGECERNRPLSPDVVVRDLNLGHEPDGAVDGQRDRRSRIDGRSARTSPALARSARPRRRTSSRSCAAVYRARGRDAGPLRGAPSTSARRVISTGSIV